MIRGMHYNSNTHWLSTFSVGEVRYIETTREEYPSKQSRFNPPPARKPEFMRDWKFSTQLFTAVAANKLGDIRYIIAVTRTE